LNSLPSEDAHGNVHPIRRLKACSLWSGAREIAVIATSWFSRWTTMPLTIRDREQLGQAALYSGPNIKW